jgi:tetratricopeptide (TPR) repeat protein
MTEQILLRVLQIDPANAPANNDLGYTWADEGRNLAKAEVLVKRAVEAEPDNQSYLDSMAWVEYKLGKFSEARGFLDRAIGPASRPDPVVLDHLGDVLYRLHLPSEAASQWQRSLKRLDDVDQERDDLKPLREQLEQKLKQQQQGKPVDVAPLMETSGNAAAIHGPSGG